MFHNTNTISYGSNAIRKELDAWDDSQLETYGDFNPKRKPTKIRHLIVKLKRKLHQYKVSK